MASIRSCGVIAAMLLTAGLPAAALGQAKTSHLDAPARKPGWWEFKATTDSGQDFGTLGLCVGPRSEAAYSAFDQILDAINLGDGTCPKRDFVRTADGWSFDLACDAGLAAGPGGGPATNQGTITGDLQTGYVIHETLAMAGATNTGNIAAAWTGDCPAGRSEGDEDVGGGTVVNVLR